MVDRGDSSYTPVVVDYLRFSGLLEEDNRNTLIQALFDHSGYEPDEFEDPPNFGSGGSENVAESKAQRHTLASRDACLTGWLTL